MTDLQVVQVALNTRDLPASLRFYAEIFGFDNAGGIPVWGEPMRLQGLQPDARAMIWWLLDGQDFFQIELFAHTEPYPRLKADDWRASDHGWVRLGIKVPDIENIRRRLDREGVALIGVIDEEELGRRIAFIDPTTSTLIEVVQSADVVRPTVNYATYSTADLALSRHFYEDVMGMRTKDRSTLHTAAHEALWGLAGAQVDGFVVNSHVQLEIVHYQDPAGRPRAAEARITDLGIMNVALGARTDTPVRAAAERAAEAGYSTTPVFSDSGSFVTYLNDPGSEVELIALPEAASAQWGYEPASRFVCLAA